jgi:drug/metabolite transporter (DMT)-like permease
MGSVRTSILGRPRRLSRERRASPIYTLNCDEPVYLVALAAAATFAVAIPLEHRAADRAPGTARPGPRQVAAFVRAVIRDPAWLAGMGLNTVGLALHAWALHLGGLSVVQPLLVANLLFALPVNHWLRREPVTLVELGWAALLVLGLVGFLLLATAGVPSGAQMADRGPAVAAGIVAALVAAVLVVAARRAGRSTAATLLGVATGVLFAVTASLIKACTGLLVHGPVALAASWQLYALVVAGAAGLLLNQLAFQAGPLSASLPAITVVDPLAAILLGVVVFDEALRHSLPAIFGEVMSLAMLAVAAVNLSRLERLPATTPAPRPSG